MVCTNFLAACGLLLFVIVRLVQSVDGGAGSLVHVATCVLSVVENGSGCQ